LADKIISGITTTAVACVFMGGLLYYQNIQHQMAIQTLKPKEQEQSAILEVRPSTILANYLKYDLFVLGRVSVEEKSGNLNFEDWNRIFRIVSKHVQLNSEYLLKPFKTQRLKLLRSLRLNRQNWRSIWYPKEYRDLAMQTSQK